MIAELTLSVDIRCSFETNLFYYQSDGKTPIDLTGYSAQIDARDENDDLIITLSTGNGRITLGGGTGSIQLAIAESDTAALPIGNYFYDLLLIDPSNNVTKILFGSFAVNNTETEVS